MKSEQHNYAICDKNNVIYSGNSHCAAYGYISSRGLYLKAHHPLAFYTSFISNTHAAGPKDYRKLKDYKNEAEKHGIKVNRLHINKSGANCEIVDGAIYYGFSKIKGIGDDAAKKIVSMQPYADYEDFIKRFGTDAKVNQALIALRVFDGSPMHLYQFYEEYKTREKRKTDRKKRYEKTIEKYRTDLQNPTNCESEIIARMDKCTQNYRAKEDTEVLSLATFQDSPFCFIDPEYAKLLSDETGEKAEESYYGFTWTNRIEKCKHYKHHTLEEFSIKQNEIGPIEICIKSVEKIQGPKTIYYRLTTEDATGEIARITVWKNDYARFSNALVPGACLRLLVNAPSKGFNNYTLANDPNRFQKNTGLDTRVFNLDAI